MRLKVGDIIVMQDGKKAEITELRSKPPQGGPTIAVKVIEHYWIWREDVDKKATKRLCP